MATRTATFSDDSIVKATGKSWAEWLKVFKKMKAETMPHKEIADALYEKHGVPGWWCQMLTVRYEQEIGRRVPGENCYGEYQVAVSATLDGDMDDALALWKQVLKSPKNLNGVAVTQGPSVTQSEKWRYWKVKLADGTHVNINFCNKTEGKAVLQVNHDKLPDKAFIEPWRAFWKDIVKRVKELG